MCDDCDNELPPVTEQIANAAKAAVGVVTVIAKGRRPIADAEVIKERRAICQGCERRKGSRCAPCGCNIRAKTKLVSESCPIGKWGSV